MMRKIAAAFGFTSFALCFALVFALSLGSAPPAAAQDAHVFIPKSDAGFWTAERYADTRPLPMPRVTQPFEALTERPVSEKLVGAPLELPFEEIFPSYAEEPTVSADDRLAFSKRLFPVEMVERAVAAARSAPEVALKNRGSLNAFDYTSSRLIPSSAATAFPYSAVGRLFFSDDEGGTFACSGAVITKRLVLTAGHCVDDGADGGAFQNFSFVPAYDRGAAPFGEWQVSTVFVSPAWAANGRVPHDEDWALLETIDQNGESISDVTGKLSFIAEKLEDNHVTMLGFPSNLDDGQEMHQVQSGDYGFFSGNTVLYGNDMGGGSSGGPWVQNFNRKAAGQGGGRNKARAAVVGVASFAFDPDVRVQGSSVLTRAFKVLRQEACFHQAGNC